MDFRERTAERDLHVSEGSVQSTASLIPEGSIPERIGGRLEYSYSPEELEALVGPMTAAIPSIQQELNHLKREPPIFIPKEFEDAYETQLLSEWEGWKLQYLSETPTDEDVVKVVAYAIRLSIFTIAESSMRRIWKGIITATSDSTVIALRSVILRSSTIRTGTLPLDSLRIASLPSPHGLNCRVLLRASLGGP